MAQVCDPVELDCEACYELALQSSSSILVNAGIAGGSQGLYLWVTTKFGTQYKVSVITADDGSFSIDTSAFPDGMFNPDAGAFDLFLSYDADGTLMAPMNFGGDEYECIIITITCE